MSGYCRLPEKRRAPRWTQPASRYRMPDRLTLPLLDAMKVFLRKRGLDLLLAKLSP